MYKNILTFLSFNRQRIHIINVLAILRCNFYEAYMTPTGHRLYAGFMVIKNVEPSTCYSPYV